MKFIARRGSRLRLVLAPRIRRTVEGRVLVGSLKDEFPQGLTVEFVNGMYETEDKAIIKALKAHPMFGMRFFSDEPGEAEAPTEEALRAENEKAAYAEELRSQCPKCGKKFKNEQGLTIHMRSHEGESEGE